MAVATTVASSAAMKTQSTSARTVRGRLARRGELDLDIDDRKALPYLISSSSTSKTSVEFGGMTGGYPRSP
jgi:hypothetical protein